MSAPRAKCAENNSQLKYLGKCLPDVQQNYPGPKHTGPSFLSPKQILPIAPPSLALPMVPGSLDTALSMLGMRFWSPPRCWPLQGIFDNRKEGQEATMVYGCNPT